MQTGQGRTATGLAQLNAPHRTAAIQFLGQFDHAIDHGVFGAAVVKTGTGQKQHGATGKRRMPLQFGDKFFGIERAFRLGARIEQAIDDENGGLLARDFTAQQFDHRLEPFALKGIEGTDELDLIADLVRVVKAQGRQILEQAFMGFGQHRGHQHAPAALHMIEGQLVGQDRLARPRSPLNDVGSTDNQAPPEQ
ncbi:hypothetical protein D3C80_1287190 [compost metagenome]